MSDAQMTGLDSRLTVPRRWLTYEEVDGMADNFGRGLRVLGMQPRDNVCLYADTRAEWLIAAQVC